MPLRSHPREDWSILNYMQGQYTATWEYAVLDRYSQEFPGRRSDKYTGKSRRKDGRYPPTRSYPGSFQFREGFAVERREQERRGSSCRRMYLCAFGAFAPNNSHRIWIDLYITHPSTHSSRPYIVIPSYFLLTSPTFHRSQERINALSSRSCCHR